MSAGTFFKHPLAALDFPLLYVLDPGVTVQSASWEVSPVEPGGLTLRAGSNSISSDGLTASVTVEGGIDGHDYQLRCIPTLSSGLSDPREVTIRVRRGALVPTLSLVRSYVGLDADDTEQDLLLGQLVASATARAEQLARFVAVQRTQTFVFGSEELLRGPTWASIELPLRPVSAVSAVRYRDPDEALQTLDPSCWRSALAHGWTRVRIRQVPATACAPDAWEIDTTVGAANDAAEPAGLTVGILQLVKHWYDARELMGDAGTAELPQGPRALFSSLKPPSF